MAIVTLRSRKRWFLLANTPVDPVSERDKRRVATQLVAIGDKIRNLEQMRLLAEEERWNLIEKGLSLGIRKAEAARLLKISDGRVHQIIKEKEGKPRNGNQVRNRSSRKAE